ncbi:MAG: hypothetical protein ACREB8_12010 [Pseudolabrys sp.]
MRTRLVLAALAITGLMTFGWDCAQAQAAVLAPAESQAPTLRKIPAELPADVAFGRFIALIRGHLLTGEALVKERDWEDAHPHFMFPLEEIYGVIRDDLHNYKTPQFDDALRTLARTVRARSARRYPAALARVERALAAADANLKSRQPDWPHFELTVAVEVVKTAAEEYEDAISNGRIRHAVGYRTARGFILQAGRMIDSVGGDLGAKNAEALRDLRDGLARLKQAFASVDAPRRPPIDEANLLAVVSRIEQAAGRLA